MYCDKEYLDEKPEVVNILMETALNFSSFQSVQLKKYVVYYIKKEI